VGTRLSAQIASRAIQVGKAVWRRNFCIGARVYAPPKLSNALSNVLPSLQG
jgi:hypothetical protein